MAERQLTGSPSLPALFAQAALGLIPGASRLPFVAGGGGPVPDRVLVRSGLTIDRSRLAVYDRVCGFDLSDTLPPTYLHVLGFPMALALMTSGSFPLPPIGLVHIANRITARRPVHAGESLSLRAWATQIRPHPRGRQFDLRTDARVGDELVWEETSTNLARGPGGGDGPASTSGASLRVVEPPRSDKLSHVDECSHSEEPPHRDELLASAVWRLPGDLGRRYAAVSGDCNPIHLHPIPARLLGFRAAIAHGMWTAARCLAALGPGTVRYPFTVEIAFRRPILLPATVSFDQRSRTDTIAFGVRDRHRETVHLDGLLSYGPR